MVRAHLFISGDVIGVGFRYWTALQAKQLGLTGWVKNVFQPRTGVEAVFEGKPNQVKKMIKLCQTGPPIAWVEKVEVNWQKPTGKYQEFSIKKN